MRARSTGGMDLGIAAFAWLTSPGDDATVRLGLSGPLLTFACIAVARLDGIVFDRSGLRGNVLAARVRSPRLAALRMGA